MLTSIGLELHRRIQSCGGRHRRPRRRGLQQSAGSRLRGTSRYKADFAHRALLLGLPAFAALFLEPRADYWLEAGLQFYLMHQM